MEIGKLKIWARTLGGLEWIAAAEAECTSGISNIEIGRRELIFNCNNLKAARQLRTVDDVYVLWGDLNGISHKRESLNFLNMSIGQLTDITVKIPARISNLRVTASFSGKRNYSRFEIEETIGINLAKRLGRCFVDSRSIVTTNAVWFRVHLDGERCRIGFRINAFPLHRRLWRGKTVIGALHPPLAAAMCILADLSPRQIVLDPFVGNGTLLIEAGLKSKGLALIGCDISPAAIRLAREHAQVANVSLKLIEGDSSLIQLPVADRIISNPPWGQTIKHDGNLSEDKLTQVLLKHLKPNSSRLVIIMSKEVGLTNLIHKVGRMPLLTFPVRVSGHIAEVTIIGQPPCFPYNQIGKALAKYWHAYNSIIL